MRTVCISLAGIILWAIATPALGGLVVTSYTTLAQTNGYAPSFSQYYAEQRLENVSPALAEVSGDWMGPNAGATIPTWHFVGSSRSTSTTTITPGSYRVEGAGSFAYTIDTTSDFIDPRSASILTPASAANYDGFFETDVPVVYAITAQLNQRSRVRLVRFDGIEIFDENNSSVSPRFLSLVGTISPGQYGFLATASSAAANLPSGINHYARSGSFENLVFTVQVPEPCLLAFEIAGAVATMIRNRRRVVEVSSEMR